MVHRQLKITVTSVVEQEEQNILVFSLKPGTIGANNYGADPKDTYIG